MPESAPLLTASHNYAVVHLPARRFPGVVFQGDSLNGLIVRLEELERSAGSPTEEWTFEFRELIKELRGVRRSYEKVLKDHGMELPYPKGRP